MKKLIYFMVGLFMFAGLSSCSIDRLQKIVENTFSTEYVDSSEEHPYGGYYVYFLTNGEITNQIFLSNGAPGRDGINGINGINGVDGISATASVELVEPNEGYPYGGYFLTIGVGDDVETVFISNGSDGIDGINGTNGTNGTDGTNVNIQTEETEGGTILIITYGNDVVRVFIQDGQDGLNGTNGLDGLNGIDGVDGTSVTITTEVVNPSELYPYGGYFLYITQGDTVTIVFISNGVNGVNGQNGTDGLDGLDGIDGTNATIRTEEVVPSDQYPFGGYWLFITVDGTTTQVFISNGADGSNGLNGEAGQDGTNSLIEVTNFGEGNLCPTGGIRIDVGLDLDNDGYLDENEITNTEWVCNGQDGVDGEDGQDGECECDDDDNDCEEEEDKVALCHKEPNQPNSNQPPRYHNIWVNENAVQSHLDHGDILGGCDENNND